MTIVNPTEIVRSRAFVNGRAAVDPRRMDVEVAPESTLGRLLRVAALCAFAGACADGGADSSSEVAADQAPRYFVRSFEMGWSPATDQQWDALSFERLKLARTTCLGTCPAYEVELFRGGRAVYRGIAFTAREGTFEGHVGLYAYGLLCAVAERTHLLELDDQYQAIWTDDQAISYEFTNAGGTKSIYDYAGQGPPELQAYRALFDDVVEGVAWEPVPETR